MTIKQFLTEWHESRKFQLRQSTYEAEEIYIKVHLIPYFEEVCPMLEELTPVFVLNYMNFKLASGRSDGQGALSVVSVRKHLAILRHALDQAVILGYLLHNPADAVKVPRRTAGAKEERVFLTAVEAQELLDSLADHSLRDLVLIALIYGLRRSEVLGLTWHAVNFQENTIEITRTVVKNTSVYVSDFTKSDCSRRKFQLLPEVREVLLRRRKTAPRGSEFIFCRPDGTYMRPDTLTKSFQKHLKRVGFKPMRFHDLRHSTASILFDRGWGVEDVREWLGHADIETTSNIYLHYQQERKILLAGDLVGMFKIKKE